MAEKKASASVDKKNSRAPILEALNFLFYISKLFGMIPYSLSDYIRKKQFKLSQLGNIFCVIACIHISIQYHFLTAATTLSEDSNKIGTLTTVIGFFIIYLEPLMMVIDVLASLINQTSLIDIFDRLREIDDKLLKENVQLNYQRIRKYSIIFLTIAVVGEVTLGLFNLFFFLREFTWLGSLYWFLSCIPLFNNSIARTWFLVLILLVQQRLRAINNYLNDTKNVLLERRKRHINDVGSNFEKDNLFIGFLEQEIFSGRNIRSDNARRWDGGSIMANKVNDVNIFTPKSKGIINVAPYSTKGESIEVDWLHWRETPFMNFYSERQEIDNDGQFQP